MAINYAALKAEIAGDPNAYGYATPYNAGADQAVADMLNVVRAGVTVRRKDIASQEVLEAMLHSDFATNPPALLVAWFESATQQQNLRLEDDAGVATNVLTNLRQCTTNGSASRTRLNNIAKRDGSRAEQLFGAGTFIAANDILIARNS